jgi:ribosome-binding factor A
MMSHYIPSNDALRSLCAEVDDEGGREPNLHSLRKSRSARARNREASPSGGAGDRKAHQLCRQVGQTLDEVLAECADVVLQGLRVESVEPCPDACRLLVTVAPIVNRPTNVAEAAIVVDHLQRASGHLRSEVATAITRKRAPLLLYRLAEPPRA